MSTRVSSKVNTSPQGFPVSCEQGSMIGCYFVEKTELHLPTLHGTEEVTTTYSKRDLLDALLDFEVRINPLCHRY